MKVNDDIINVLGTTARYINEGVSSIEHLLLESAKFNFELEKADYHAMHTPTF